MDRRTACITLAALSSLARVPARAQATRIARIAWASISRADPGSPFLQGFRSRFAELGWVEGRNLVLDTWWADGSAERLKELVPQIVASRPDVIVATGGPTVRYFMDANIQVPVAFTLSADVVVANVVKSWSRPGVNRTGVSFFSLELVPKRLALMKELLPSMKRVAIVGWPPHAGELLELEAAKSATAQLGLLYDYYGVNSPPNWMRRSRPSRYRKPTPFSRSQARSRRCTPTASLRSRLEAVFRPLPLGRTSRRKAT